MLETIVSAVIAGGTVAGSAGWMVREWRREDRRRRRARAQAVRRARIVRAIDGWEA